MSVVTPDEWLSRAMRLNAYRVDMNQPGAASDLADHARDCGPAFYYAKVDTTNVDAGRSLGAAGFYVVDVNVTFEGDGAAVAAACDSGQSRAVAVGLCRVSTAPAVLEIAESSFEYSRFHLDPAISPAVAGRIKRAWVQSYVDGTRGDRLFVAVDAGRPVGFLAALATREDGRSVATIDLISVARDARRRGIARALIARFAAHYPAARFRVVTQAANLPSLAMYEHLGFSIARTSYVFHRHMSGTN